MRTLVAATAALSAALLLAACAGPDTVEPAAETSATPEASTQSEGTVDALTTCRGYYDGGDLSIHARVTEWAPAVAEPATEENASELLIIRDRIDAQLRYADVQPAAILQTVQAPFTTAIEGGSADPTDVENAAAALAALCGETGYSVPE
ncbi:hypothetical protein [Isoptericola dokdonensis]|jgi:hypothetical protein|uniref:Lipoprotein n=1 Tax=Isoptericola dokdonensis DS-3 TaxID=1300344 RepID=A0A161IJM6_9MICO|nr:hypothetical protein [Isoptericola dokdonensis]ANC32254.1 hypothetical protein I598_2725 [Isoptericola dokdonensis DS-3]